VTVPDTLQDSPAQPDRAPRTLRSLGADVVVALLLIGACALLGLLMGQFWHLLAPRVPLHADSNAVYLNDPEGEQAIGADGTFALLGAAFGVVSGAAAYVGTRFRQGGVGVAVGLTAGGLLGAYVAWGGGQSAKAYQAAVLHLAKTVPTGHTFDGPLQLTTKAVLLIWPILALLTLLGLTAIFSPRRNQPQVEWPAPQPPTGTPSQATSPATPAPSETPSQTPAPDLRKRP
jgi:hypothetical protein